MTRPTRRKVTTLILLSIVGLVATLLIGGWIFAGVFTFGWLLGWLA